MSPPYRDDVIDMTTLGCADAADVTVVYAIGDIHGRLDLLDQMEAAIQSDIHGTGSTSVLICYLGDYIDRGPHSSQVIDRLSGPFTDGIGRVFLKGNHEDRMLDFLDEPVRNGPAWMKFGGREALESYGLEVPEVIDDKGWLLLGNALNFVLPNTHRAFLQNLRLGLRWRDFLFVHAGLHPETPPQAQSPRDLMWIREPFLSCEREWGFRVVHGHVIVDEPEFRSNRIGIDTGAYKSGRLTCLVATDQATRILQVSDCVSHGSRNPNAPNFGQK